jgi:hypothetical protein
MTYAAYLRIYQPVAAFHEPDRSRWAAYAASSARPRRRDSLAAEQAEALHRAIAVAGIVLPDQESEHAYVRRADGVTYVCPWQAIDGVAKGERELALAMYQRAQSRWRALAEYEMAN